MMSTTKAPLNTSNQTLSCDAINATNRSWLDMLSHSHGIPPMNPDKEKSPQTEQIFNYFLAALSPSPEQVLSKGKDFQVIKKALISVYEAMEENILSESEANALIEFLVSKFVERRFDVILNNVFDVGSSHKYTFHGIRGEVS